MRMSQITTIFLAAILSLSLTYAIAPVSAGTGQGAPIGWTILAPNSDPIRTQACTSIETAGTSIGLNVHCNAVSFNAVIAAALDVTPNYQSYILGWSLGVVPTYLFDFFHSSQISWSGGGSNNIFVNDSTLDPIVNNFRFNCADVVSCSALSRSAESYIFNHGYYFPMYNRPSNCAVRNDSYIGYYNQIGYGFCFPPFWEFMNAHVAGCTPMPSCAINANNATVGRPLTYGLRDPIKGFNPIKAGDNSVFDVDVYSMIFDSLTLVDPVTLQPNMPWLGSFVKSSVNNVHTGGIPGLKYSWTLASNATWANGAPVTAYDLQWSIDLLLGKYGRDGAPSALFLPSLTHLTDRVITGPNTIDVYYNSTGYFTDYDASLPIFPSARWNGTDGVMGSASTAGTQAFLFKNAPSKYEPGKTSLTNITNFFLGTGAYQIESFSSTTNVLTLIRRGNLVGSTPYWRPDPTAAQAFTCLDGPSTACRGGTTPALNQEPTATGSSADRYHAPWVKEITFQVLGADQSVPVTTAGASGIDMAGWNIPTGVIGSVKTNLVKAGKGWYTDPANFGMFYWAINLQQGSGPDAVPSPLPFGSGQNPFVFTWNDPHKIGPLFTQSLNHLINRAFITNTLCGSGCKALYSMVPAIYSIGGNSFHNSTIDSDPIGLYNPGALNATLTTMAGIGLTKFVNGLWYYGVAAATPVLPNPLLFLAIIGAAAPVVYRRIKTARP